MLTMLLIASSFLGVDLGPTNLELPIQRGNQFLSDSRARHSHALAREEGGTQDEETKALFISSQDTREDRSCDREAWTVRGDTVVEHERRFGPCDCLPARRNAGSFRVDVSACSPNCGHDLSRPNHGYGTRCLRRLAVRLWLPR